MFDNILLISSWLTAAVLMFVAWYVYKYSKSLAEEVKYWNHISSGVIFLSASEIMRPLFLIKEELFWIYWILSAAGGIMISYGFYNLYQEEKV